MGNTLQRLKEFIDSQPFSMSSFEKFVGFSNGSLASQIKNNKTIGVDKLEHILSLFPNLSADWLFRGRGEMLKVNEVTFITPKAELKSFVRQQNITQALTDIPESAVKITPRQIFIAQDNFTKLSDYLRNIQGEFSGLLRNIEQFENLRDFTDEFSRVYTDAFFNSLFDTSKYIHGSKFDYQSYKNDAMTQLDSLKEFNKPLAKLVSAYQVFLKEIESLDTEKITANYPK